MKSPRNEAYLWYIKNSPELQLCSWEGVVIVFEKHLHNLALYVG